MFIIVPLGLRLKYVIFACSPYWNIILTVGSCTEFNAGKFSYF